MAPRTEEQFEKIRKERRQAILDAALKVISEKGFHGASIASIAKDAGVSKGLMYNYFKSKEDLLTAIMLDGYERIFSNLETNPDLPAEENVMLLVEKSFEVIERLRDLVQVYFSVMLDSEVFILVRNQLNELSEPLMQSFAKMMAELGFKDPASEAYFLRFILDGISLNYLIMPEQFPKEYCIGRIRDLYLNRTN
jgi:AcrR family transcriptional regulator